MADGISEIGRGVFEPSLEAKLRELLHRICSVEIKLCSDATKEFIKLLKGETGGELLHLYVGNSSKLNELIEAWKLRQAKQGVSYILFLVAAILNHPDGKHKPNSGKGINISRPLDKFAKFIIDEKMNDVYKELTSKEGKRQKAALVLLSSIVRRGSGLASDVAKKFDFKIQGFGKLAEYKGKHTDKPRKHSTRKAFVEFGISFLKVGKPGLLRWILQQKEMYSCIFRGLVLDDDETTIDVLLTLRDKVLVEESFISPGLRSVLFGSVTLEQLVSLSARDNGGPVAELAHDILIMVCTDPCNGLMPDPTSRPKPLRGNPRRLLMLMKMLPATEICYHKDLLMAIVRGRPSLASSFLDEFPYNVEDCASPTWFSSVSLAANLIASVGMSSPFGFLEYRSHGVPSFDSSDVQNIMKCICPRVFSRSVINKGLLHSDFLVKHGTLRLLFETLNLLDSFLVALISFSSSSSERLHCHESLVKEIQNEARYFLPDPQVLLALMSSLSYYGKSQIPSSKRKAESKEGLQQRAKGRKKSKKDVMDEDADIIIAGISSELDISPLEGNETTLDTEMTDNSDAEKEFLDVVSEIWASELLSKPVTSVEDAEIYYHTKLLDVLRIYLRTIDNVLEGSFDFFMSLLGNPLMLPADLQRSLLALLSEYIGLSSRSIWHKLPSRTPIFMYKHLLPFLNLFLLSPFSDIKNLAYDLAQAAMLSSGAFDRNQNEVGAWFLFLRRYGRKERKELPFQIQGVVQSMSSVIISFLCDAVSTVGNNLYKYWDVISSHASSLKYFEGVAPDFSPLIVCVLQKCLRLLSSESKTYSLSEKSTVSLYVCTTLKYILQTQVDAGLLSSLIRSVLSGTIDESKDSFCEWRPLSRLLLLSQSIRDKKSCYHLSDNRNASPADTSFTTTLDEVKKLVRCVHTDEMAGIAKAFSSTLLCTIPDVVLENFPSVVVVSEVLLGAPAAFLWSMVFLEQSFLVRLSEKWPDIFLLGLEMAGKTIQNGERVQDDAKDMIHNMDLDATETSAYAFSRFVEGASFHVLFPAIMSSDMSNLLEPLKIKDLLLVKISESRSDCLISHLRLLLFWFYQIQLMYRLHPASTLEQLSEICLALVKHLLSRILELKPGPGSSNDLVLSYVKMNQEVAPTIFCHPIVMTSLQYPTGSDDKFGVHDSEISLETFLSGCRQTINKIDHQILHLLTTTFDHLLSDEIFFLRKVDLCGANKSFINATYALSERLLLDLRKNFELCLGTESFTRLLSAFYPVHALIRFISPIKLLELARWMFSRVDKNELGIRNSGNFLSIGFNIAGDAFEMLSMYLRQPTMKRQAYSLLWKMEDNSFDADLIEEIYAVVFRFATGSKCHFADICFLKALDCVYRQTSQHLNVHPTTLILSQVVVRTPLDFISHCISSTNMIRAKSLFFLVEVSSLHLSIFGQLFLGMLEKDSTDVKSTLEEGVHKSCLTDEQFLMLLPAALSYLKSAFMKFEKKHYKNFTKITSTYERILLKGLFQWRKFVSSDIFEERYEELFVSSTDDLHNLFDASLIGKAYHMLQCHLTLSEGSLTSKKLLKLFNSVFQSSAAQNELLDNDLEELGSCSFDKLLNVSVKIVAKVSFSRMLLFPEDSKICSPATETVNEVKGISSEMRNARMNLSERLINILVDSWLRIVTKSTLVEDASIQEKSDECLGIYKSLEDFFLRSIVDLTTNMCKDLGQLQSISFLDRMMKSALLYRFEDPTTLKRLRSIFSLLSEGKASHAPYLQLLLSHSQFVPIIRSLSTSSISRSGELFRPMSSILKSLVIPRPDSNGVAVESYGKSPKDNIKQLEIIKLLRVLLFNSGKDTGINLKELHFLLLSSYSATLSRIDVEIYKLMCDIELIDESHSVNLAETDHLWGKAAMKIRKEQSLEPNASHVANNDSDKEHQRGVFRENICVEPEICASTALYFPHQSTVKNEPLALDNLQPIDEEINKVDPSYVRDVERYNPVFILHFSIHCLSMGYIEPVEFSGLGLLAIAFTSLSSADLRMRQLGYKTLAAFQSALENCRKNKDTTRLKLLLTYVQNGIEEPWQRLPSVTSLFAAEISLIMLDPSHEHYSALSKLLMHSSRVKLKGIPVFLNFFWSTDINFRTQRLWLLRLLYTGINLDDDANVYIRNSILHTLMSFYSSPIADDESKEIILQIVRKSVEIQKLARHLVEHCGLLSWLSSLLSVSGAALLKDERRSSPGRLLVIAEVIEEALSSRNIVDCLQTRSLEQLMEVSSHLYNLLSSGLVSVQENAVVVDSVLQLISSTLVISQKRELYQPHFNLSREGLFRIYETVSLQNNSATATAELGLRTILMNTPPVDIVSMDPEKLSSFLLWATSTALASDGKEAHQPKKSRLDTEIAGEEETLEEESLASKFLRWLIASVIIGRLYSTVDGIEPNFSKRLDSENLQSLLEHTGRRCHESSSSKWSDQEKILSSVIYYLQQSIGVQCRVLPSVVSALSLLLFHIASEHSGTEFMGDDKTLIESLCLRIQSPPEANSAWRWSFFQAWKDVSSEPISEMKKIDELQASQTLLVVFANMFSKKPLDSGKLLLSPKDVENCGLFRWERSLVEAK